MRVWVLLVVCVFLGACDSTNVVRCWSGGVEVAEYTTSNMIWYSGARLGFDLDDGRKVITTGTCIAEEK